MAGLAITTTAPWVTGYCAKGSMVWTSVRYGAQYGRTASGVVQVTTRSGTNRFHGNLHDFTRNEAFNARNYFDLTSKAPLYRRQDFGGTIGGPLTIPGLYNQKKDKTFFFFFEEVRLEKTPVEYNQAVPGLKDRGLIMTRQGIRQNFVNVFQAGEGQIFDFSDVCPPTGALTLIRQQYPDCPATLSPDSSSGYAPVAYLEASPTSTGSAVFGVDKNALQILNTNLIPLPNSARGCNYAPPATTVLGPDDPNRCYVAAVSPSTDWREELFRLDHNFAEALKISFRCIHDDWDTTVLTPQWSYLGVTNPAAETFPTVQNRFTGPGISLLANITQTITPTLINNFGLSYVNSTITSADKNGPGGAQFERNPALDSCVTRFLSPQLTRNAIQRRMNTWRIHRAASYQSLSSINIRGDSLSGLRNFPPTSSIDLIACDSHDWVQQHALLGICGRAVNSRGWDRSLDIRAPYLVFSDSGSSNHELHSGSLYAVVRGISRIRRVGSGEQYRLVG